jgi:hypothetical protein
MDMKSFVYTAKDASGALKRGGVEAADRADALASLKAKGLTPVSLAEGRAPREANGRRMPSALMALLVVAGCAVLVVALLKQWPKAKPGAAAKKEAAVAAPAPREEVHEADASAPAAGPEDKPAGEAPAPDAVPVREEVPVPPRTVPAKPAVSRPTRVITPGVVGSSTNRPRQVFTTGTEQVISWIANSRLGDPPPILPVLPIGENIEKILDTEIALYDDDDAKTEMMKTNVAKMKQAMKEFVAGGGDPQEFLQFYQGELKDAFEEWRTSQAALIKKIREGDKAAAAAFLEERSKELEAKGIKPLAVPPFLRKNLDK